jgi:hypothetical protein
MWQPQRESRGEADDVVLKVGFPDDGQPEIIWLNANSGVPVQEKDGSNSATTFEVERVTAANLALPELPPRPPALSAVPDPVSVGRGWRASSSWWSPADRSRYLCR